MKIYYICLDSWPPSHFEHGFFCFSDHTFGNGVCSLVILLGVVNLEMDNSLKWPLFKKSKLSDNKRCTVEVK